MTGEWYKKKKQRIKQIREDHENENAKRQEDIIADQIKEICQTRGI